MKVGANIRGLERHAQNIKPLGKIAKNDPLTTTDAKEKTEQTKQIRSDESSQKGVIRNLQDGHFKGVADVRLRINFQAELNAIRQESGSALVRQTAAEITATDFC